MSAAEKQPRRRTTATFHWRVCGIGGKQRDGAWQRSGGNVQVVYSSQVLKHAATDTNPFEMVTENRNLHA